MGRKGDELMKTIKVTLCTPPCDLGCPPECPEVEITDQGVMIGEAGPSARRSQARRPTRAGMVPGSGPTVVGQHKSYGGYCGD